MAEEKFTRGPWSKASRGFEQKPSIVGHLDGRPSPVAVFEKEGDRDLALAAPKLVEAAAELRKVLTRNPAGMWLVRRGRNASYNIALESLFAALDDALATVRREG